MQISLIITVRNEEDSVGALMESIARQTRAPGEVVVVDGGSTDQTVAEIRMHASRLPRLELIELPGANIAKGRNAAIAAAHGEIIAVTDAGARLDPGWLESLSRPIENGEADVSAGFFRPSALGERPSIELAIAALMVPIQDEIDPEKFLPSSRSVAYRRSVWQDAGGYPEWLPICEDVVFDLEARRRGARFAFAPAAIALWDTPRTTKRYLRQLFRYTRGDGHAGLWLDRQLTRYATYLGAVLLIVLGSPHHPIPSALLVFLGLLYTLRFFRRAWTFFPDLPASKGIALLVLIPALCFLGDLAKMAGWPVGVLQRASHRIPPR